MPFFQIVRVINQQSQFFLPMCVYGTLRDKPIRISPKYLLSSASDSASVDNYVSL